mmetsp:Transcript_56715/g.184589  ORF Transcript_56715/g.184589 Transcript_56715/m.184589 type:complete len:81 (-) Transcript_56715:931-1173(-)
MIPLSEVCTSVMMEAAVAAKRNIKAAVEKLHDAKCSKKSTLIRPDGQKEAFGHEKQDFAPKEAANRTGRRPRRSVRALTT